MLFASSHNRCSSLAFMWIEQHSTTYDYCTQSLLSFFTLNAIVLFFAFIDRLFIVICIVVRL